MSHLGRKRFSIQSFIKDYLNQSTRGVKEIENDDDDVDFNFPVSFFLFLVPEKGVHNFKTTIKPKRHCLPKGKMLVFFF